MVKVKICGITTGEDAAKAADLGVHALGFIFAPSPRRVSPERAGRIIHRLPPFVTVVGVFVNEDPGKIEEVCHHCGLDLIQFHGDESPELCKQWMPRTIKAFQMRDEFALAKMGHYREGTKAFLLDACAEEKRGGTGKVLDWNLALKAKALGPPLILSGGLGPSNIEDAIRTVRPYAVDVNSGVEEAPGKKDHRLLKRLMEIIYRINQEEAT